MTDKEYNEQEFESFSLIYTFNSSTKLGRQMTRNVSAFISGMNVFQKDDIILTRKAILSLVDLNCSIPKQATTKDKLFRQYGLEHSINKNLCIRNTMKVHFRELNTRRKNCIVILNDSLSTY